MNMIFSFEAAVMDVISVLYYNTSDLSKNSFVVYKFVHTETGSM